MNKFLILITAMIPALALLPAGPGQAVTVLQCKDASGAISFQDRCPPGATQVGRKTYAGSSPAAAEGAFSGPVTLYRIPDCGGCEQVKEFMTARGISVTEKEVNDNPDNQQELQQRTGQLQVPTVVIGEKTITGYNRSSLLSALSDAGYQPPEQDDGN